MVLVIDDNPGDVYLLKMALYSTGVPNLTVMTDNGLKAVELCRGAGSDPNNIVPDIVFLDLHLQPTNSFDVLDSIRHNPFLDSTAVVIVSGSDNPNEVALCFELKANAFMLKLSNIEEWCAQIHAALRFWLGISQSAAPKRANAAHTQ